MVTMTNYSEDKIKIVNGEELIFCELRGLSDDTKPTKIGDKTIENGSVFIEIDTQKLFFFDADSQTWKGTN